MSRRSPRNQSRKRKSNADEFETFEFEKNSSRQNKRHSMSIIPEPSIVENRLEESISEDPSVTAAPGTKSFSVAVTKSVTLRRRRTIAIQPHVVDTPPPTFNERNYLSKTIPKRADCFVNSFDKTLTMDIGPLPKLAWADSNEVWRLMLKKDRYYCRNGKLFDKHKALEPRMRSILFDWIVEVSEVYHLHRETFYLAMDFADRYLSKVSHPIQKQQLQLIGVTCLFIAAKLEEIYPPKVVEFAFVTDQACDVNEILSMEHIIMKVLDWDLAPITAIAWLNMILQLSSHISTPSSSPALSSSASTSVSVSDNDCLVGPYERNNNSALVTGSPPRQGIQPHPHHHCGIGDVFLQPIYDALEFIQIAQLLDLCMLDQRSLSFRYSVIAVSGYHLMATKNRKPLSKLGFDWSQISSCVDWMSPFATVLRSHGEIELASFKNIDTCNMHNIQTNVVDLDLLEEVRERQSLIESANARLSPDLTSNTSVVLTPPASSSRKLSTPPRKDRSRPVTPPSGLQPATVDLKSS